MKRIAWQCVNKEELTMKFMKKIMAAVAASWFAAAILIIAALPLGLIFARILTDRTFRYCT